MNIIIKARLNDYIAYFENNPEWWGCGVNKNEAVGDLVTSHTEMIRNFQREINELTKQRDFEHYMADKYRNEIDKLKETLTAKQALIDKQSAELQHYNKLCDINRNLSIKDGRMITTLLTDIRDRDEIIEEFEREIERLQTGLDEYQCDVEIRDETITDLKSTIAMQQKQTNKHGRIIKDLQADVEDRDKRTTRHENTIFALLEIDKENSKIRDSLRLSINKCRMKNINLDNKINEIINILNEDKYDSDTSSFISVFTLIDEINKILKEE